MDEDERRRFELEAEGGTDSAPDELDFENPRDEENMGRNYPDPADESTDPTHRPLARRRRHGDPGPDAA